MTFETYSETVREEGVHTERQASPSSKLRVAQPQAVPKHIRQSVERAIQCHAELGPLVARLKRAHDSKDPKGIQDAFCAVMEVTSRMDTAAVQGFGDAAALRAERWDHEYDHGKADPFPLSLAAETEAFLREGVS